MNSHEVKYENFNKMSDKELLMNINMHFNTPDADYAKSVLNYRLKNNIVKLIEVIQENSKSTERYNRKMFWLIILIALLTFSMLIVALPQLFIFLYQIANS